VFEDFVGRPCLAHHLHTFTACLSWHTKVQCICTLTEMIQSVLRRQSDTCCRALDLEDSFSIPLMIIELTSIRARMQL
jgi:hypothetical protein